MRSIKNVCQYSRDYRPTDFLSFLRVGFLILLYPASLDSIYRIGPQVGLVQLPVRVTRRWLLPDKSIV